MLDFIRQAAHVRPNEKQLRLLTETPFYAFVHFSPNTYTGLEWGTGKEPESIFNPTDLDCDQWCEAFVSTGMKGVVLTAKHHDGFCLWQSKYTEHCMKNSPYKNGQGDIVRELSEACRRHGLKFGFYLSPWDRHSPLYGTEAYNDYYKNQLTELLTGYGDIFHVWFDGACGEGPNGKRQVYDFEGYLALIEKYQPDATYFNDAGVIRWCGNESGTARNAEWAVVPKELCYFNKEVQTGPGPLSGNLSYMYNCDKNIGSLSNILYSEGLVFSPSEMDMSIRPGWFYHENEEPHSLERLFNTYLDSVGANTTFNLNVPPMPNGRLDERDVVRLKELGEAIRKAFRCDIAVNAVVTVKPYGGSDTQQVIELAWEAAAEMQYLELKEDLTQGQRVESFQVYAQDEYGVFHSIAEGTTIGARKIVRLKGKRTKILRVLITAARDVPKLLPPAVYIL